VRHCIAVGFDETSSLTSQFHRIIGILRSGLFFGPGPAGLRFQAKTKQILFKLSFLTFHQ